MFSKVSMLGKTVLSLARFVSVGGKFCTRLSRQVSVAATNKMSKPAMSEKGEFVRTDPTFRDEIKEGGEFPPESGRYHLYVSYACPWAHRTLITRRLKGLESAISFTVVDFLMLQKGWRFNEQTPGCEKDPIFDAQWLRDIYEKVVPGYTGRVSVPVLLDKKAKKIVNNESSEIIRMFNCTLNEFSASNEQRALDFYPAELRDEIDAVNDWIFPNINLGVYRCGFATAQEAYDKAAHDLFENLDKAEELLSKQRYLVGNCLTEADIRFFTTLVRFDQVYHGHFKCNKKRIIDYPNIWAYLRELYQIPAFGETTDMNHIRKHYMMSHLHVNPHGIVSFGPDLDFNAPHDRNEKFPIA